MKLLTRLERFNLMMNAFEDQASDDNPPMARVNALTGMFFLLQGSTYEQAHVVRRIQQIALDEMEK